jgi:prepilin-type N-terminal cleavage/methylation domain-containing protein
VKHKISKKIKENKGFTLVEALIAVIILAIVSVLMVQGVSMARKAYASNKIKTEASALANQEIEKIRSMPFNDIGIINGDPAGTIALQVVINSFTVTRSVSFPDSNNKNIKQVKIIISNPSLANSIKVVTEITPIEMSITALPTPRNLVVISDLKNSYGNRTVNLQWSAPSNPPYGISSYKIYRNGAFLKSVGNSILSTSDSLSTDYSQKTYYITVVYSNGAESDSSNIVKTTPS